MYTSTLPHLTRYAGRLRWLSFFAGLAVFATGYAQTTLTPTADRDTQSDNTAGTNPTINYSAYNIIYAKFSLSSVSGTVTAAKLRIHRESSGCPANTTSVYEGNNDTWSESGTVPGYSGAALGSVAVAAGGPDWVEIPLSTAAVQTEVNGDHQITLAVTNDNGGWTSVSSREGANPEQLVITTSTAAGGSNVITSVRYFPRSGYADRMSGGVFQGSNDNANWATLATVGTVADGTWGSSSVTNSTAWRYVRYVGPANGWCNVAEVEFYNGSTKLTGTGIGTAGSWNNQGDTFAKALDANTSTFFDGPDATGDWVGLDFGSGGAVLVTGISVSPSSGSIAVNGALTLTATVSPSNAANKTLTWQSSNPGVASVNGSGIVTGVAVGTATITAKSTDGSNVTSNGSAITVTQSSGGTHVLTSVRYYPRVGFAGRMVGGTIQGSNDAANWTTLATVSTASDSTWGSVGVSNSTAWRYVRYVGPTNGWCNVSELEFYNGSTKLTGNGVGTAGSWSNQGNTFDKALDGNTNTFFDGPDASGDWVGLDFGSGTSGVQRPSYNTGTGFFVIGNKLYDANGVEFRIRGVNDIGFWRGGVDRTQIRTSMKAMGVNTVRMVLANWNASISGSDTTDTPAFRQALAQSFIDSQMVPVAAVWVSRSGNTLTCSNNAADLSSAVDDWVGTDAAWVKALERYVIVDIANEWGPGDTSTTVWRDSYIQAVQRIRNAGINCTLMIDAGGCGEDLNSIVAFGNAVLQADPQKNIIFSIHAYGAYWNSSNLASGFQALANTGLCLVVGEFSSIEYNQSQNWAPLDPASVISTAEADGMGWMGWEWYNDSAENIVIGPNNNPQPYPPSSNLTPFGTNVRDGLTIARPATIFP